MDYADVVEKNALTPHLDTTFFTGESHTEMLSFHVILQSICSHTFIFTIVYLALVRAFFVYVSEVTFHIEFTSSFEMTALYGAFVTSITVLGLYMTSQRLTRI